MYAITSDDYLIHYGGSQDKDYLIISGTLQMSYNMAGSLTFTVPSNNVAHKNGVIQKLSSVIKVYKIENGNKKLIWKGRVIETHRDFYNTATYNCEGWLGLLNDIVQLFMHKYPGIESTNDGTIDHDVPWNDAKWYGATPEAMFKGLIDSYNIEKRANYGTIYYLNPKFKNYGDAASNDPRYNYPPTNGMTILDYLQNHVVNDPVYGGHLWVGDTEVHFDLNPDKNVVVSPQVIRFGENLSDLTEAIDATKLKTRLYGKAIVNGRVNIATAFNTSILNLYGNIDAVYDFGNATSYQELLTMTQRKAATLNELVNLTFSAIDLSAFGTDADRIRVGNYIRLVSEPNDIDTSVFCTGVEFDLVEPTKAQYTFGMNSDTLSGLQIRNIEKIKANNISYIKWLN